MNYINKYSALSQGLTLESMGHLKCGVSRKWLIVDETDENLGLRVLHVLQCTYAGMKDTFDAQFLEFGLGSFGAHCKISNFTIFKPLLFSQLSSD